VRAKVESRKQGKSQRIDIAFEQVHLMLMATFRGTETLLSPYARRTHIRCTFLAVGEVADLIAVFAD
jgi:hypothetical protein